MNFRVRVDEALIAHVVPVDGVDWLDDVCTCTGMHAEHNATVIARALELLSVGMIEHQLSGEES